MGQLLKCLSLLWTLNVLNLFKHTYMVTLDLFPQLNESVYIPVYTKF